MSAIELAPTNLKKNKNTKENKTKTMVNHSADGYNNFSLTRRFLQEDLGELIIS